jgi:hypothetical protein
VGAATGRSADADAAKRAGEGSGVALISQG